MRLEQVVTDFRVRYTEALGGSEWWVAAMQGSLEKEFQQVGGMARPAGVPGGLGSSNLASEYYGKSLVKGTDKGLHALATASPYAERAEPGWAPKEPTVRPTWADKGAGVVSAGCIDNTYMPAPLKNKWGKCREMTRNEVVVLPHKQATDLLAVTLGTQMPLPKQEVHELANVREKYSAPIPLYHQMDPLRSEGGFVRTPNIIPGALPPPVSPLHTAPPVTMIPDDWKQRKLQYEQEQKGLGRIPVLKKVSDDATRGAVADHASFLRKPAGLPGGLSLIPVKP